MQSSFQNELISSAFFTSRVRTPEVRDFAVALPIGRAICVLSASLVLRTAFASRLQKHTKRSVSFYSPSCKYTSDKRRSEGGHIGAGCATAAPSPACASPKSGSINNDRGSRFQRIPAELLRHYDNMRNRVRDRDRVQVRCLDSRIVTGSRRENLKEKFVVFLDECCVGCIA